LPNVKCYRKDLFQSIYKSLDDAEHNQTTVNDAMIDRRNTIRRMGRKVYGKCLGTTLLTKGLEFETVVIMNIHKFTCPKNLYVALTRASKRLIIFISTRTLAPYSK
jgi:DNA helicase-2/ATP-dependent DNA helicase PcrA